METESIFDPPPATFPQANVYVPQHMLPRIRLIHSTGSLKDWNNATKKLTTIVGGSAAEIGKLIHVWQVPWMYGADSFAPITGYGDGPPAYYEIWTLALSLAPDMAYYTIGLDDPLSVAGLWLHFFTEIGGIPPGAIRWGKLWLDTLLAKITHSLTNVHWDGPR